MNWLLDKLFSHRYGLADLILFGLAVSIWDDHGFWWALPFIGLWVVITTVGEMALERRHQINALKRAKLWPPRR